MSATIRLAVLAQINDARGPAKWKADSFTEISSVQADPTYQHEHTLRKNRLSPVSKSVGNLGHEDDQDYDDDCSNRAGDERSSELDDEENLSAEAGNQSGFSEADILVDKETTDGSNDSESDDEIDGGVSFTNFLETYLVIRTKALYM
ncbi:hypothetical protein WAI453_011930 [Rhynchosporium graminicola]